MKMIFDGGKGNSVEILENQQQAVDLIREVEVPVCLNLALCYIKTEQFHHAIKYASQMLDKNLKEEMLSNGKTTLEKAFYRRGVAYLGVGDLKKAKEDLLKAHEFTGKNQAVREALKELK